MVCFLPYLPKPDPMFYKVVVTPLSILHTHKKSIFALFIAIDVLFSNMDLAS